MKFERTQIHFLSDVFVAVASLDLKVPILARMSRWRKQVIKCYKFYYFALRRAFNLLQYK